MRAPTPDRVDNLVDALLTRNENEAKGAGDEFDEHPLIQVLDETADARSDLFRPEESYHHMPWAALDGLVGGMPGGEVCYVAAFSSSGKTTFLTSYTDEIFETTKKKIYYMGLESKPKTLRTHWACKRLGYDSGDLLTGEFLKWSNMNDVRSRVDAEIKSQGAGEKFDRVRFCPTSYINATNIYRAAEQAAEFGADIFIIDHVDHIDGSSGRSGYEASVQVNQAILDIAQNYGFLMIPATQLNNEAVAQDRIQLYLPPREKHIKWGGGKREKASWMLGLYRPLRLAGNPEGQIALVNKGLHQNPTEVCEPNTMAVVAMKHRHYGNREWQRVYLRVEKGKVFDADQTLYFHKTITEDGFRMAP
jgi:KaiC/GvpD/RAD55 family RecA-like ATPase